MNHSIRRAIQGLLLMTIPFMNSSCSTPPEKKTTSVKPTTDQLLLEWIKFNQDTSSPDKRMVGDILQGQTAQTFNNALAAMAFMVMDERERAERILDFYAGAADAANTNHLAQNFFCLGQARGFYQNMAIKDLKEAPAHFAIWNGDRWMGDMSWLLIAYAWERPLATGNALLVFLTNRVGDAGFLLGIGLAVWTAGSVEWAALAGDGTMSTVTARLLALGFVLAALVKSAQLPFTPWIARALEGPTPSSAVFYGSLMVHAGVYLLCRLQGLLVQVPDMLALLAVAGLATALYGGLCALVQSDVKSALIFSTVTQVGLMFLLCGLGFFWLAACYSGLHAAWRAYQFPLAPAYMHLVRRPARPVPRWLAGQRWLYTAALQRFWIEPLASNLLTRPTLALGRDVRALDERFIDPLIGAPRDDEKATGGAPHGAASLLAGEAADALIRGHGVAGRALLAFANRLQLLEDRLLLSGDGVLTRGLERVGHYVDVIESLLEQPRYLMLMVMATFVVIL